MAVIADLAGDLVSGSAGRRAPSYAATGPCPFLRPIAGAAIPAGTMGSMEPRVRDLVGAAVLTVVLIALVVLLVAANVPRH
jgi:hypothetical protein